MLWKSWNVFVKDLEMLPSVQELGLSYISFLNTFMSSTWFGLTLSVLVSHVIVQFSKASSSVLKLEESQNLKQCVWLWLWLCAMEFLLSPRKHRNVLRSLGTIWTAQVWPCQSFETVWEIILEILLWPGYYCFFPVPYVALYLLERDHSTSAFIK